MIAHDRELHSPRSFVLVNYRKKSKAFSNVQAQQTDNNRLVQINYSTPAHEDFNYRKPRSYLNNHFPIYTVEPRYNEGPKNWQNMFAMSRLCCVEVVFHIFYYY